MDQAEIEAEVAALRAEVKRLRAWVEEIANALARPAPFVQELANSLAFANSPARHLPSTAPAGWEEGSSSLQAAGRSPPFDPFDEHDGGE
jgi:hypothetical protein